MAIAAGLRRMVAGLVLAASLPAAGMADCRLALALAFDVSRSVDQRDYAFQKDGILAALSDPAIVAAFLDPEEPVAFALYEWSRNTHQWLVVDWTLVESEADLAAIRQDITDHERMRYAGTTAMGEALRFGARLMERAPDCTEQVIDVSGDGSNNSGVAPNVVTASPEFTPDRVNGLVVLAHERTVIDYYQNYVIWGPGAFLEVASEPSDFPRAIRKKLLRELSAPLTGDAGGRVPPRG